MEILQKIVVFKQIIWYLHNFWIKLSHFSKNIQKFIVSCLICLFLWFSMMSYLCKNHFKGYNQLVGPYGGQNKLILDLRKHKKWPRLVPKKNIFGKAAMNSNVIFCILVENLLEHQKNIVGCVAYCGILFVWGYVCACPQIFLSKLQNIDIITLFWTYKIEILTWMATKH